MIDKLVSINTVIAKVVEDLGLEDQEIRWQSMIEWIADGLILIGAYTQFQEKEAIILIEDYKGVLPCDFHKSIRFMNGSDFGRLNGSGPYWNAVNKALKCSGYQETNTPCSVKDGNCYEVLDMYSFQKLQLVQYNKVGYFSNFYGNIKRDMNLMDGGATFTGLQDSYNINFDTVTASFRYGAISLRYLAIAVDENGYPLVPDDPTFREALMWRCAEKLAMRGHQFKNPKLNDFELCKWYWDSYCESARGVANFPDPDLQQQLANIWRGNLLPNYNQYYIDNNQVGDPSIYNLNGIR